MTRVTKDPEERRNEIVDAAEELILAQGFKAVNVSDIVKKVGVAQGLFYYYFKSKDDVLDAIVERYALKLLADIEGAAADPGWDALAKLRAIGGIVLKLGTFSSDFVTYMHQGDHGEIHQRVTRKILEKLIPVCAGLVRQGAGEGLFRCENPEAAVTILLVGIEHYMHQTLMQYWGRPEFDAQVQVVLTVAEQTLGAKPGSLQILT